MANAKAAIEAIRVLVQARGRTSIAADTIVRTLQSWLDWHEAGCRGSGIKADDGQHIMSVPVWPTRGTLKAWIKEIRAMDVVELVSEGERQALKERDAARALVAAKDARLAELDTLLAQRPAGVPEAPKPNPFRSFAGDRRRIGR